MEHTPPEKIKNFIRRLTRIKEDETTNEEIISDEKFVNIRVVRG
jgi:hypothetical protein